MLWFPKKKSKRTLRFTGRGGAKVSLLFPRTLSAISLARTPFEIARTPFEMTRILSGIAITPSGRGPSTCTGKNQAESGKDLANLANLANGLRAVEQKLAKSNKSRQKYSTS